MKQSTASKTFLAIITILTVMMALLVPSPVYAAGKEPPPPPPPPSNDTKGNGNNSSHSSVKDLSSDTTVVVTNNGTPMSLAAQLTVDILTAPAAPGTTTNYVKFCKEANPDVSSGDCTSYRTIQGAIDAVASIKNTDASGYFYVDVAYTPVAPGLAKFIPIVLDQAKFSDPNVNGALNLQMLGGYDLNNTGLSGPTTLIQPFNIKDINAASNFTLDNFVFNIAALIPPAGDASLPNANSAALPPGIDALSVTDSNHVTLSNLTINDTNLLGNGIGIYSSNDVNLDTVIVNRSGGVAGAGISVQPDTLVTPQSASFSSLPSSDISLKNVTVTNSNSPLGDGINITGAENITMDNVSATSQNVLGAFLKDNGGSLSISNSTFNDSGYAGLYVTGQDGPVVLSNVTADNNGNKGLDTIPDSLKSLEPGLSSGAAFVNNSGTLIANDSTFSGNTTSGLTALSQSDINLNGNNFIANGEDGASITSLAGNINVKSDTFNQNGQNGLTAASQRDIYLADVFAGGNVDNGAELTSASGAVTVFSGVFGNPFGGTDSLGNGKNGLVATALAGDVTLGGKNNTDSTDLGEVDANQNGASGIVGTSLLGDIRAQYIYADQNGVTGALLTSPQGSVNVQDSGFDANDSVGLVALGAQNVFVGWSEASGNQYVGALLGSQGDVAVTNSDFMGSSDFYTPASAPQMLGLGVAASNVYLDGSQYLPGSAMSALGSDYGVDAGGNGVMGALLLSAGNIQVGDSAFDENGASVSNLGLNSLLGDGLVAVGSLSGSGQTELINTEANGNTSFGVVLFNTDSVAVHDSSFDNNGIGGLLGLSLGDVLLDNVDASTNGLLGAATLSAGYTSVNDSIFDGNGAVGLLSIALGPVEVKNVETSQNGLLGAGLASVNLSEFTALAVNHNNPCSDSAASGDICVNNLTANANGFIGAAVLGTHAVEIDHSLFTGNDGLGDLAGVIPGGGLVAIGGESTALDQVAANNNFGFGAVVGNAGGVYDILTGLLGSSNSAALAISQAVGGPAALLDLGALPIFTNTGDVVINQSSFSKNDGFGLLAVANGDVTLHGVDANSNGDFGAAVLAEGNVDINHSHFNHNGSYGLYVSIFSPEAGAAGNTSHSVTLEDVVADHNATWGASIQANTADNVDVSVTDSFFNYNEGSTSFGLGIDTTGDVFVEHVAGDHNAGDGANLTGNTVTIRKSHFNFNDKYGLVVNSLATTITHTNVCWNKVGPDNLNTNSLFKDDFAETCTGHPLIPEQTPLPWQIIKVFTDPGKNSGTLSCQFGTIFLYLEKKTSPTPDFEWARAVLPPCIVPGGSLATFLGLAEGALPAPLPDGITFQGKAFDLSITGPNGQPIDLSGSPMMVRFTLPDGYTLPAGKKLDILWFDPAGKKWVDLTTYASGKYALGYASHDGAFVLAIK